MVERFLFLPVAIIVAMLMSPFQLPLFATGIIIALAILGFDYFLGKSEVFQPQYGYACIAIGVLFFVGAFYVCDQYNLTFEILVKDRTFPRFVRRLPYFGVAFLSMGAVIVVTSIFRQR